MTRRELATKIADSAAADADLVVRVVKLADGVVALLRDREEVAFRVLEECQTESEGTAIGRSSDRAVWCVVCPSRPATNAVLCRLAEELHLYDGLDTPLAAEAGIRVVDKTKDADGTLETFAAG